MTENEAIEVLSNELRIVTDIIGYCRDFEGCNDIALSYRIERKSAYESAISALKEIQQYREIGTVQECREAVEKQKAFCESVEKYADGKCIGYGKSEMDDEPIELCKRCKSYVGFDESEEE